MFLVSGRKPGKTQKKPKLPWGEHAKHTNNSPSSRSNPGPWRCEGAASRYTTAYGFNFYEFGLSLDKNLYIKKNK